jgi:hypothetical protein
MTHYEWRVYDIHQDDWDSLETKEDLTEALATDNMEVWLYRLTDDWLTDKAEVVQYKLPEYMPEEGWKVPKRYHQILDRLAP